MIGLDKDLGDSTDIAKSDYILLIKVIYNFFNQSYLTCLQIEQVVFIFFTIFPQNIIDNDWCISMFDYYRCNKRHTFFYHLFLYLFKYNNNNYYYYYYSRKYPPPLKGTFRIKHMKIMSEKELKKWGMIIHFAIRDIKIKDIHKKIIIKLTNCIINVLINIKIDSRKQNKKLASYLYNTLVQMLDNNKLPYPRLIVKLYSARLKQI